MLVNLTPNPVEIARCQQIAKEHDFEYTPQSDPKWSQGVGIYQCNMGFNFHEEEFLEKLNRYDINKHLFETPGALPKNFKLYIQTYGVADTIDQIKEFYKKQIKDKKTKWVISLTPVFQDLENKGKGGGWRWHKWGTYIGTLNPQYEYLDDEDFGEDFKYVICFSIMRVESKEENVNQIS